MSPEFSTDCPQPTHNVDLDDAALAPPSVDEAWRAVCETLQHRLSAHSYTTYVAKAKLLESSGSDQLVLGYDNQLALFVAQDTYRALFEEELLRVLNHKVHVRLEVLEGARPTSSPQPRLVTEEEALQAKPRVAVTPISGGEPPGSRRLSNGLDTRYTFDSFVVGASNQFAFAACKAVSDAPGKTYNPLFMYGKSGLGKTHLMQAVGHKAWADDPTLRVLYTTSEQFTNELIQAIRNNRMLEFRKRYRELDILLIDDIQFMAKKPATEEEFFHTFNELHARGKQIIVTSDTVPQEIDSMQERLRTRFQWGLIADVQPPEMETRVAILKTKAAQMQMDLDDDVAQFLATNVRQNVRELEGSLVRLSAWSNLITGKLTVEICKDLLRSILVNRGEKVDCDQIMKACADTFRVTLAEMKSPRRDKQIARARQAAMYLSRELLKLSFPDLGRRFGRDHSTVITAHNRVQELMNEDPDFRRTIERLERELSAAG